MSGGLPRVIAGQEEEQVFSDEKFALPGSRELIKRRFWWGLLWARALVHVLLGC